MINAVSKNRVNSKQNCAQLVYVHCDVLSYVHCDVLLAFEKAFHCTCRKNVKIFRSKGPKNKEVHTIERIQYRGIASPAVQVEVAQRTNGRTILMCFNFGFVNRSLFDHVL